jgi:hypothetical protein
MTSEILSIGTFQLMNLVQSRVPFILVRDSVEIEAKVGVLERMHLRNFSVVINAFSAEQILDGLKGRQARFEDPIVLMDQEGHLGKTVAQELTSLGYQNVLFVVGGWKQVAADIDSNNY